MAEFILGREGADALAYYNETNFMFTPVLKKVRNGQKVLTYNDETKKYIEIRYS